jgi:uncharacterized membrane protein
MRAIYHGALEPVTRHLGYGQRLFDEEVRMLVYVGAYVVALVLFAGIDVIWLTTMGAALYRSTLGDILLSTVRIPPAIAFYLLYPLGIVVFAVVPALKSGSSGTALLYGALFGLFTYATYELTNFATLRNWTLKITAIDMIYGAVAVGIVSLLVYLIAQRLGRLAL